MSICMCVQFFLGEANSQSRLLLCPSVLQVSPAELDFGSLKGCSNFFFYSFPSPCSFLTRKPPF